MAKLLEKTGAEIFASLVNIAKPIGNITQDESVFTAISDCIKKISASPIRDNNLAFMMMLYADLAPILFNEAHMKDILLILAEIEGCSIQDMISMNGADLVADAVKAWKEQLGPFLERAGLMASIVR
jgi:hypothetical protein